MTKNKCNCLLSNGLLKSSCFNGTCHCRCHTPKPQEEWSLEFDIITDNYYNLEEGKFEITAKALANLKDFFRKEIELAKKEERDRIIKEIEDIKKAIQRQMGTFKYDSCYDDCIKIVRSNKSPN